jgi:hypothetical protein
MLPFASNDPRLACPGEIFASLEGADSKDALSTFLDAAGARRHPADSDFVAAAGVRLIGVGGMPFVRAPDGGFALACAPDSSISAEGLRRSGNAMIGYGGMMSYLNPQHRSAEDMFALLAERGETSAAHMISVNLLVAGVSVGVENEFNGQRDLIHLARITVARSLAQGNPPLVVRDASLLPAYRRILDAVRAERSAMDGKGRDFQENANLLFPAAKATGFILSGTLRSFQKLFAGIDDLGKESEYRAVLSEGKRLLGSIWPFLA